MPSPRAPVHLQEVASLDSLKPAPNNPRRHDLGAIIESLKANGFVDDIVVDRRTGCILGGHGRWEALKAMQKAGDAPPDRVSLKGGKWYVPVNREVASRNDTHAARIVIVLNRAADLADNDEAVLAQMLVKMAKEHELAGSGYDGDALDDLLKDLGAQDTSKDDLVPEPPKKAITKPGDLWQMGEHRILCGDSTKQEQVNRLMGAERATIVFTDPPYGIQYHGKGGASIAGDSTYTAILLMFAGFADVLAPLAWVYVCGGSMNVSLYSAMFERHLHCTPRMIVWDKQRMNFRHNGYHSVYELVFVGFTEKAGNIWHGSRKGESAQDIWRVPPPTGKDREHLTQKPVELPLRAIANSSAKGEVVYDPFLGSGSTLIAAQKTGRRCRAIEIEPRYVDVAVERWQTFAHGKATRQSR